MLAEPKRAEVIVGGAAVLLTLLQELDFEELMVSEADILDGLAASLR
jgi:exopolyphosphatase/pppGpp-phosphohydrolase